jgi:hypothetical protein
MIPPRKYTGLGTPQYTWNQQENILGYTTIYLEPAGKYTWVNHNIPWKYLGNWVPHNNHSDCFCYDISSLSLHAV